jgi:hypothetical protein
MFEILFENGTICRAERVVGVLSPNDDAGDKTYYVAQINNARRRIELKDVAKVEMLIA